MEAPLQPTVFVGREIAVDRDELPDFRFDAEPEPDFSDSDPEIDAGALRAFNEEVREDAQDEEMNEDVSAEGSDVVAITNDAVDLLKQHNEAEKSQQSESEKTDIIDDAPNSEPEDGAMADEEDEVAPASPIWPAKTPTKKVTKFPAKSPTNNSTKSSKKTATTAATKTTATDPVKSPVKSPAKAPARRTLKSKKKLPTEKPIRMSNRVSKPRVRAAAQTEAQPKPAAGSRKKTTTKAAPKPKTSGQEWEIESIVGSMIDETHEHYYEVKWKGYSSKDNTWEPKVNLAKCQTAIRAFEAGKGTGGKRKSS